MAALEDAGELRERAEGLYDRCADVTSHAIVLWLQTLGPIV